MLKTIHKPPRANPKVSTLSKPGLFFKNNISNIGVDERIYKTDINFEVLGYIIGESPNGDRPKIIKRENAVEVKVGRERVILGDIPEHGDGKSFFVE